MILGHFWMVVRMPANRWFQGWVTLAGVSLLYCGFALTAPFLVWVFGQVAVRLVAAVLRVRYRLLSDQVGRAAWRSAGICCGLMVGLSLIVSLVVHSESLAAGWDFPKDFCEAFVYVAPIPRARAEELRRIPGVADSALVNADIKCTVRGAGLFHFPTSRFVAGDPEEFFRISRLEFREGDLEEAIAKLKKGGYVLVTPEFVRAKKRGYGDKVYIRSAGDQGYGQNFEIAGVVTSPALDIAANYFNAGGMLVSASVHVVMGTLDDASRVFRLPEEVNLFLLNFDLPTNGDVVPPEFEQPKPPRLNDIPALIEMLRRWRPLMPEREGEIDAILRSYARHVEAGGEPARLSSPGLGLVREALAKVAAGWDELPPAQRWQDFREELVLLLIARQSGSDDEHGSVRALKLRIDRDLRRATMLFTTVPMVALIVAALGVANLMMANVTSRIRQIAMLRAIGATRWQIIRLVTGEALVLGTLGSLMGLVLGLVAAYGLNTMTFSIWGYQPHWSVPTDLVVPGVAFTMLVCLIAGIVPARHAARNNIIDALQTT